MDSTTQNLVREKVCELSSKILDKQNWGAEQIPALQNSEQTQHLVEKWLKDNYTAFEVFNRSGDSSLLDDWRNISASVAAGKENQEEQEDGVVDESRLSDIVTDPNLHAENAAKLMQRLREHKRYRSPVDMHESIDDIKSIEEPLLMFVRAEMANEFQKVAVKGNFFRNPEMLLLNFEELKNQAQKDQNDKGMISRLVNKDQSLREIQQTKNSNKIGGDFFTKNLQIYHSVLIMQTQNSLAKKIFAQKTFIDLNTCPGARFKLENFLEKFQNNQTPQSIEIQEQIFEFFFEEYQKQKDDQMLATSLKYSFKTQQLSQIMKICANMINDQEKQLSRDLFEDQIIQITKIIEWLENTPELKQVIKQKDNFLEQLFQNILSEPTDWKLDESTRQLPETLNQFVFGNQEVNQIDKKPEQSFSALEMVCRISSFLAAIGQLVSMIKIEKKEEKMQILLNYGFTISQTISFYENVVQILENIFEKLNPEVKMKDEKQRKTLKLIFQNFFRVLVHNLQALKESENSGVQLLFGENQAHKFYKKLLKMLFNFIISIEEDQKDESGSLKASRAHLFHQAYEVISLFYTGDSTEIINEAGLDYNKLVKYFGTALVNLDSDFDKVCTALELENNEENKAQLQFVQEYLRLAWKVKHEKINELIFQIFSKKLCRKADEDSQDKHIIDIIFVNLCGILMLASDSQESKAFAVLQDVERSVEQVRNKSESNLSSKFLYNIIIFNALSILKNPVDPLLGRQRKHGKLIKEWQGKVQSINVTSGQIGRQKYEQFATIKNDEKYLSSIPQISKVTLYEKEKFMIGIKIMYKQDPTNEILVGKTSNQSCELELVDDDYIKIVTARTGAWFDQIRFETKSGKVLEAGGNGGNFKKAEFEGRVIGLHATMNNQIQSLEVFYIGEEDWQTIPITYEKLEKEEELPHPDLQMISQSDIFESGIDSTYLNSLSPQVQSQLQKVEDQTGITLLDKPHKTDSEFSQIKVESVEANDEQEILTEEKVAQKLLNLGQSQIVDDFVQVLQKLLMRKGGLIAGQSRLGGDTGLQLSRAAFTIMLKYSGMLQKVVHLVEIMNLQDFSSFDKTAENGEAESNDDLQMRRVQTYLADLRDLDDTKLVLREWESATKMRKWFIDERARLNIDQQTEEGKEKAQLLVEKIVSKAQFLLKMKRPAFYNSVESVADMNGLKMRMPSYAREKSGVLSDLSDQDEISQTMKAWKSTLNNLQMVKSARQKREEMKGCSTNAILLCLQSNEISKDTLQTLVESNILNACGRLLSFQILNFVLQKFVKKANSVDSDKLRVVQNVVSTLTFGLSSSDATSLSQVTNYLDGIRGSGMLLEELIRGNFFEILGQVAQAFTQAPKESISLILQGFEWKYRARDFKPLEKLKIFHLLFKGEMDVQSRKEETSNQETQNQQSSILTVRRNQALSKPSRELLRQQTDLYIEIVSRLIEPATETILAPEGSKNSETRQPNLAKGSSVINVDTSQLLLQEAFDMFFREFHEFLEVLKNARTNVNMEELVAFHTQRQKRDDEHRLPIMQQLLDKILQNSQNKTSPVSDLQIEPSSKIDEKKEAASKKEESVVDHEDIKIETHTQECLEETEMFGGMFTAEQNQEQYIGRGVSERPILEADDPKIPQILQEFLSKFKQFSEDVFVKQYINCVIVLIKTATKSAYPLQMLQNIANPYHIRTLLEMIGQVSISLSVQIVQIIRDLILIGVPMELFEISAEKILAKQNSTGSLHFTNKLVILIYSHASRLWKDQKTGKFSELENDDLGTFDVSIQLVRVISLIIKKELQTKQKDGEESVGTPTYDQVVQAFRDSLDISNSQKLSKIDKSMIYHILEVNFTMPIIGDKLILHKEKDQAVTLDLCMIKQDVLIENKFGSGYSILPEIDSLSTQQIRLDKESLRSALDFLKRAQVQLSENDAKTNEIGYVLHRALVFKILFRQIKNQLKSKQIDKDFSEMREEIKQVAQEMILERNVENQVIENTNHIEFILAQKVRSKLNSSLFDLQSKESQKMQSSRKESVKNQNKKPPNSYQSYAERKGKQNKKSQNKVVKSQAKEELVALESKQESDISTNNTKAGLKKIEKMSKLRKLVSDFMQISGTSLLEILYGFVSKLGTQDDKDEFFEFVRKQVSEIREDSQKEQSMKKFVEASVVLLDIYLKNEDQVCQILQTIDPTMLYEEIPDKQCIHALTDHLKSSLICRKQSENEKTGKSKQIYDQLESELNQNGYEENVHLRAQFDSIKEKTFIQGANQLSQRYAKRILFEMYQPSLDLYDEVILSEDQFSQKDIADVMASFTTNANSSVAGKVSDLSARKFFQEVQRALNYYSETEQILKKGHMVECAQETKFTSAFLDQLQSASCSVSNINQSSLQMMDIQILADRIKELFEYISQSNNGQHENDKKRQQTILAYTLEKLVQNAFDLFIVEAQKDKSSAQLISMRQGLAASNEANLEGQQMREQATNMVGHIKLLAVILLSKSFEDCLGQLAPKIFEWIILVLTGFEIENISKLDRRVLVDLLFVIVEKLEKSDMDANELLTAAKRLANNPFLKTFENKQGYESLLNILLGKLIARIDLLMKKLEKTNKVGKNISQATQDLENLTLQHALIEELSQEQLLKNEIISRNEVRLEVPIHKKFDLENDKKLLLSPLFESYEITVEESKVKESAEEEESKQIDTKDRKDSELKIQIHLANSSKNKLKKTENKFDLKSSEFEDLKIQICQPDESNVYLESNPERKLPDVGHVLYTIKSNLEESLFCATAKQIYRIQIDPSILSYKASVLELPEGLDLEFHKVVEIHFFNGLFSFTTENPCKIWSMKDQELHKDTIDGKEKVKLAPGSWVFQDKSRFYVTQSGQMYSGTNGLEKLSMTSKEGEVLPVNPNLARVKQIDSVKGYQKTDKVDVVAVGGEGKEKYGVMIMRKAGLKDSYLVSFGCNTVNQCGYSGSSSDYLHVVVNQFTRHNFTKLYLFPEIAFATDSAGILYVIGGKLNVHDDTIFPKPLGCTNYRALFKTKLNSQIKKQLDLQKTPRVVDLQFCQKGKKDTHILIKMLIGAGSYAEVEMKSKSVNGGEMYLERDVKVLKTFDKKQRFLYNGQIWVLDHSNAEKQEAAKKELEADPISQKALIVAKPQGSFVKFLKAQQFQTDSSFDQLKTRLVSIRRLVNETDLIKSYIGEIDRINAMEKLSKLTLDKYNADTICKYDTEDSEQVKSDKKLILLALINFNFKFEKELNENRSLKEMINMIMGDPLLDNQNRIRNDFNFNFPSIEAVLKFQQERKYVFKLTQMSRFESLPMKPAQSQSGRVSIEFVRFKAQRLGTNGQVDRGEGDSLFSQLYLGMKKDGDLQYEEKFARNTIEARIFRANFLHEGSIDDGGPYREAIEDISRELQSPVLPILVPSENQRKEIGILRECFVLNHQNTSEKELAQVRFFGVLIGSALRSLQSMNVTLHPTVWKQIVGEPYDYDTDLKNSNQFMHQTLMWIRNTAEMFKDAPNDEDFQLSINYQAFTVLVHGDVPEEVELCAGGSTKLVTRANAEEYIDLASKKLLHLDQTQMGHFLEGVYAVIDKNSCRHLTWENAQVRTVGEQKIDIELLKKFSSKNGSVPQQVYDWFFEVLSEMDEVDKQLYLKWVNGRGKLPADMKNISYKHSVNPMHVSSKQQVDGVLPQAHVCYFQIDLPAYTSKEILRKQVLIAIRFCGEIDTDRGMSAY